MSVVSNSNCWSSSNYILQGKWDQVGPSAIKGTRLVPATKITQDVAFRLWEMFILLLTWSWLSSSWQELRIFRQHGDHNTSLPDVQWQEGPWSTAKARCDKKGFNNTTYFLKKERRKYSNRAGSLSTMLGLRLVLGLDERQGQVLRLHHWSAGRPFYSAWLPHYLKIIGWADK